MKFDRKNYSDKLLIDIYKEILKPRLIEEKMLILLRQNKISKWFSGWGQEGISVGSALAMQQDEYILPMHRNLGVFTARGIPFKRLFSQFQGNMNGFTKGRDRSFHFGTMDYKIVGMISHLGPQLGIADGIALAWKLKNQGKATLVYSGDGGTSEGDFHEALNVAAVWDLPVIFCIENNGYGLSTPSNEQFKFKNFTDKAIGYGIEASRVDGNNILEVYSAVQEIAESMRNNPRPHLLECITFRMRGHEESSGTKYIPKHFFEEWAKKDPIDNYENYLLSTGVISEEDKNNIRVEIKQAINDDIDIAFAEEKIKVDTEYELNDIYAPYQDQTIYPASPNKTKKRFVDAISDGLNQSLEKHPNLILMGQDIAEYGGVFKVTENFVEKFGKDRIRNTPLCESAIIGTALGLSMNGFKTMVEMQFADFVSCGFNQIVNNLAKLHYRWGEKADVVVRLPTGAGVGAGPFHSQSNESWFFHVPGLKIVYPAFPSDAKGLLNSAFNDINPVLFFEHKQLYRSLSEEVFDDYYTIPIGKANLLKEGNDLTIVTYGAGVHWALATLDENPDIKADLIDLRTLMPYDKETIANSIKKTNKVIILHEDTLVGGIGGEIAAWISYDLFEYLDAPVFRTASLDTPVPFAGPLEDNFLPKNRFKEDLLRLWKY
jgi:2-oxoisovalerate dehydrogenase E1 component